MSRQQQARANNPTKEIVSLGKAHDFAEQFPKVPLPLGLSKSLYEMLADFVFFTPALANLHGAFVDGHFVDLQKDMTAPLKIYKHKFFSSIFKNLVKTDGDSSWNHTLFAIHKDLWPALEDHICGITMFSLARKLAAKFAIQTFNIADPLASDLHMLVSNVIPIKAIGIISNNSTICFKPDELIPYPIKLPPEKEMQTFFDAFAAGKNPLVEIANTKNGV